MKTALILGIGGQDGSYLADILTEQGWSVHGLYRHSSYDNLGRVAHLRDRVTLHRGDVTDWGSIHEAVRRCKPDHVYHMADQDSVGWSFAAQGYQHRVTAKSVFKVLNVLWGTKRSVKVFVPLSCTMFGTAPPQQDESTPLDPQSPYAKGKVLAWEHCKKFRGSLLHINCGIMFNHDSPRRSPNYLLQKICREAVELVQGRRETIALGSLDTRVDVGYAREYMEVVVKIMELPEPGDYCVGTGKAWSIRKMLERAFGYLSSEHRYVVDDWWDCIGSDPAYVGKVEPTYEANTTKLCAVTGWTARYDTGRVTEILIDHFVEESRK